MRGERVRVALVGCGKIAAIHAKALAALHEADFVA
jgi:predicted dehydrogenase